MEIQRSQYIRLKFTVYKGKETIQGRNVFKGGNYMRKYGRYTKCSDGGMGRPGKPVGLPKICFEVRTFQNTNKDDNLLVKAFVLLACFRNLL